MREVLTLCAILIGIPYLLISFGMAEWVAALISVFALFVFESLKKLELHDDSLLNLQNNVTTSALETKNEIERIQEMLETLNEKMHQIETHSQYEIEQINERLEWMER